MWPFTGGPQSLWLSLYLVTFCVHVVLISYVLVGTGFALIQSLRRKEDPIAERARDLLPFMLGLGITAGVAPLLFLQLLYQRHFYTSNLLLGPRWGAVVPALIVGFYALYLAKATSRLVVRRLALGAGLLCFTFVAWSWTEINQLMQHEPAWRAMYAAGDRLFLHAGIPARLLLWLGAMATLFATVASWWAADTDRRRLAITALAGRAVSGIAVALMLVAGTAIEGTAHGWLYVMFVALGVELGAWIWLWRVPAGSALMVITGAGTAALVAGAVVREAPRLALIEPPSAAAMEASGFPVFALTAVVGIFVIAWIVRATRT